MTFVMNKVVCAISGGVDSAVAALLLKRKGFRVAGAFMRNWDLRDENGHCGAEEDRDYAMRVCRVLDIPFHEVDFVKEYWNHVFQETVSEYEAGHTPNPDVLCNRHIKFDAFLKYSMNKLKTNLIATGHYARTDLNFLIDFGSSEKETFKDKKTFYETNPCLYWAVDESKDQTFFLHKISAYALSHTLFPVGGMLKSTVKKLADTNGLDFVSKRKESMGICFIGLRDFSNFLLDYIPPKRGHFICLETGRVMGEHNGYFLYTLGQCAKLPGLSDAYFVAHKDKESGNMFVVPGTNHPALYSNSLITDNPHWINGIPKTLSEKGKFSCEFRFMHRDPRISCTVYLINECKCLIVVDHPLRSLTPGQSAVLYSELRCLGGATILNVGPSVHECDNGKLNLIPSRTDCNIWEDLCREFGDEILPSTTNTMDSVVSKRD